MAKATEAQSLLKEWYEWWDSFQGLVKMPDALHVRTALYLNDPETHESRWEDVDENIPTAWWRRFWDRLMWKLS